MPSDKDLQDQFQSAIGGAQTQRRIRREGDSDTLEAMDAADKATYAAEASRTREYRLRDPFGHCRQAAQMVIGHATTYGSTDSVVPSWTDPSKFEGAVNLVF